MQWTLSSDGISLLLDRSPLSVLSFPLARPREPPGSSSELRIDRGSIKVNSRHTPMASPPSFRIHRWWIRVAFRLSTNQASSVVWVRNLSVVDKPQGEEYDSRENREQEDREDLGDPGTAPGGDAVRISDTRGWIGPFESFPFEKGFGLKASNHREGDTFMDQVVRIRKERNPTHKSCHHHEQGGQERQVCIYPNEREAFGKGTEYPKYLNDHCDEVQNTDSTRSMSQFRSVEDFVSFSVSERVSSMYSEPDRIYSSNRNDDVPPIRLIDFIPEYLHRPRFMNHNRLLSTSRRSEPSRVQQRIVMCKLKRCRAHCRHCFNSSLRELLSLCLVGLSRPAG